MKKIWVKSFRNEICKYIKKRNKNEKLTNKFLKIPKIDKTLKILYLVCLFAPNSNLC